MWKAYARTTGRAARAAIAVVGVVGAPLAPFVLLVMLANAQGAIVPLSSVMRLLPMSGAVEEVAEIREHFAAGTTTPVLDVLVADFAEYHAALVVAAAIAAVAVVVVDIALWIRWSRIPRENVRLRRVTATVAVVLPTLVPLLLFLMVVNGFTALDAAPALAAFYEGSF